MQVGVSLVRLAERQLALLLAQSRATAAAAIAHLLHDIAFIVP